MPKQVMLWITVPIPRWKKAIINGCIWVINRVVRSVADGAKAI